MLLKIFRLSLALQSEFNQEISKFDLTFQQWIILKAINTSSRGQLTNVEIVDQVRSDKSSISILIKKLEKKGMIVINHNPDDKRQKLIELSPTMIENCSQVKNLEDKYYNKILKNYTKEEIEVFNLVTNKIENNING